MRVPWDGSWWPDKAKSEVWAVAESVRDYVSISVWALFLSN